MEENNINITPEMISKLADILKNSSDTSSNDVSTSQDTYNSFNNIDFETILKMKSMIDDLNKKDDPRSNLLYSLKPYLRKTRQEKIDQYINLFKISKITNLLKNEKGG